MMIENGATPEEATKAIEDRAALEKGAREAESGSELMDQQLEQLEGVQASASGEFLR